MLNIRTILATILVVHLSAAWAADVAPQAGDPAALRFDITSFSVENATLLTGKEIQAAVSPYVGKGKDFSDVQLALEALEAAYAERGYSAVQVLLPEQELENGRIRFRVVESRFGLVTVKGQKFFTEESVRNALRSVRQGGVPRSKQIARELKLANENPARQLNVVLKAGKVEEEVDAEVQVADQDPTQWSAYIDNSGSEETGQSRLGISYRHANLQNADHVGAVQLQVSPQEIDRVHVIGGSYKIPLYSSGNSVEFFGGYSNVNSVVGGLTNFQGGGMLFSARYNQYLEKIAGLNPRISYGYDWRNFRSIEMTEPSKAVLYNEITVTPLSVVLAADTKSERSDSSFDIGLSVNLPMTGKGKKESFETYVEPGSGIAAFVPDEDYRIVRYNASHVHGVGEDMQVRVVLAGQWTRNLLILGEQMRLGGMNGVRGFTEGAEAGETGVRGSLEGYLPKFDVGGVGLRGLVFLDGGKVSSKSGVKSSIASAGLGLRGSRKNVSFRLDAGRIGKAGTDPLQEKGDWRIHAAVSATF
ncbi:MAG: ShlB/FhaC/HecB family hemolysin secretion/activation protein [Pseudomonadota bacterium]